MQVSHELIQGKDGAPNYVLIYNGPLAPGTGTHRETNGHTHPWEHTVYILEGSGTIVVEGKNYCVTAGDAILVPPNALHQWKNESETPMLRLTINPMVSETSRR